VTSIPRVVRIFCEIANVGFLTIYRNQTPSKRRIKIIQRSFFIEKGEEGKSLYMSNQEYIYK
jgi:hypothetical protein